MVVGFVTFLKFVIIESHMVMVQLWDTEVMGLQLPHGYDILKFVVIDTAHDVGSGAEIVMNVIFFVFFSPS